MEYQKKVISIILPSYNDCEIIGPYHKAITDLLVSQDRYDWELIYVDDGSTDGSVEFLKELASVDTKMISIELSRNFGQQKALFCGMDESRGDIVITLDGDFQYPPEVIMQLSDKMSEGYDIVSGVRLDRNDPFLDRLFSAIGQYFVNHAISRKLSDFGAVKAFSRFVIDNILKNKMFTTQVYGLAYNITNNYTEIPVKHLKRYMGKSKWSLFQRLEMYLELFLLFGEINLKPIFMLSCLMISIGVGYVLTVIAIRLLFDYQLSSGMGGMILASTGITIFCITVMANITLKIYKSISYKEFIIVRSRVGKK
ncbi:MAG: glycosyltransferase family 2 protein [Nitrospirae bacterium]|nr:glycosyltransferase family 2 protein [Nitrospirota bacterium]